MEKTFPLEQLEKYLEKTTSAVKAMQYSGSHLEKVDNGKFAESGQILRLTATVLHGTVAELCKEFNLDLSQYFPEE